MGNKPTRGEKHSNEQEQRPQQQQRGGRQQQQQPQVDDEAALAMIMEGCIHEILPKKLYLGNQFAAGHRDPLIGKQMDSRRALEFLKQEHGITHIVCVTVLSDLFPSEFQYLSLPFSDSATFDLLSRLETTNDFINKALLGTTTNKDDNSSGSHDSNSNNRVLVHCQMGQSRSAAVVMAYLMWSQGMSSDEAFRFVKSIRAEVTNERFGAQLQRYEEHLKQQKEGQQRPEETTQNSSPE